MPQRCESNTPSTSSQNTQSRQLKHPGHIRIAILNHLRGSEHRALRCDRPAFPLSIPCAYLFASGWLCSNHFPAAFHLPGELGLKHVNQSSFKGSTLSPRPRSDITNMPPTHQTLVLPKSWQAPWLRLWTLRQCAAVCRKHSPCRHVHKGKRLRLPCAGMNLWAGPGSQLQTAENCRAQP